ALALVITKGEDYTLSLETASARPSANLNDTTVEPYWSSLEWVRFLLSDGRQHTQHYIGRHWHWQKNA
ncbi:beta-ketoacyl synthase chain length factor, partial [Neisseria sp. P0022.S010]|uniref:beta-ketoacyl synthase chain length factor n=1 Tax=Neisseria sp. P0022.S010 TaxID=3436835 RepID=UPI003F813B96